MNNTIRISALLSFVFLSACASSNRFTVEPAPDEPVYVPQERVEVPIVDSENRSEVKMEAEIEDRLRYEVAKWDGTPHVFGGETEDGIDCSAFVQQVFARALDLTLPRTTLDQVEAGRPVDRRDLRAGDLVFFRPQAKSRHVGIYLRDGEFAHASTSRGVMISHLGQDYWDQAFWTTRRVLPDFDPPSVAGRIEQQHDPLIEPPLPVEKAVTVEAKVEQPRRERIGW